MFPIATEAQDDLKVTVLSVHRFPYAIDEERNKNTLCYASVNIDDLGIQINGVSLTKYRDGNYRISSPKANVNGRAMAMFIAPLTLIERSIRNAVKAAYDGMGEPA